MVAEAGAGETEIVNLRETVSSAGMHPSCVTMQFPTRLMHSSVQPKHFLQEEKDSLRPRKVAVSNMFWHTLRQATGFGPVNGDLCKLL